MAEDVTDLPLWRRLPGPGPERWERRFGPGGGVGALVVQQRSGRWSVSVVWPGAFAQSRADRAAFATREIAQQAACYDVALLFEIVEARR